MFCPLYYRYGLEFEFLYQCIVSMPLISEVL